MVIKAIPIEIIRQIAAGEVITRPVNIIKELVENSIDSSAKSIQITFENGGIDRIEVKDDGQGIPADQVKLAFELHTSSKLSKDNIGKVSSLGFRGEALSSIVAVARVKCRSKTDGDEFGKEVVFENSEAVSERQVRMRSIGTTIEVLSIFFNTPARRKYLKSGVVEKRKIIAILNHFIIINHKINWKVYEKKGAEKKVLISSAPRKSLLPSIFDTLGGEISNNLIKIQGKADRWSVNGFISNPSLTRKDRSLQFISVNQRIIKSDKLSKTVEKSYKSQLMKRHYPIIVLNFDGNYDWVDYNIHPQKEEIRFSNHDKVMEILPELIERVLFKEAGSIDPQEMSNYSSDNADNEQNKIGQDKINQNLEFPPIDLKDITEELEISSNLIKTERDLDEFLQEPKLEEENDRAKQSKSSMKQGSSFMPKPLESEKNSILKARKKEGKSEKKIVNIYNGGKALVLGQIMKKFALIDAGDELWIMDIHASDERIKFEQYEDGQNGQIMSQKLIVPQEFSLSKQELSTVKDMRNIFERYGMKISTSIGEKILIHSIPAYFDQEISKSVIKDFFYEVVASINTEEEALPFATPLSKLEYYVVSRLACHGSIRSGYYVSSEQVRQVLSQLLKCRLPWTCAHGRPTLFKIKSNQLEAWFKR